MTRRPAGEIGQGGIARVELDGTDEPARGGSRGSRRARPDRASEPVGEALVQLRTRRLRQRLVGRVADQQMAEAVPLVLGEARGRAGSAPCARASSDATRRRREQDRARVRATAPRWNTSPSTEPRSMTTRTSPSSESMRAWRSAWIVGGTTNSPPPPCSRTIATISSTIQRVASRGSRDAIARGLVQLDLTEQVGDQVVALVRR